MHAPNFHIRNALPEDASKWAKMLHQFDNEVHYSVFEPGERSTHVTQYKRKIVESQMNCKSAIFLVFDQAILGEPIVGFLYLNAHKNKRRSHVATVGIGVLKSHYEIGIGNQLAKKMFEHAKRHNLSRIEANIAVCNHKSIKLAKKFGFVIEGRKINAIKIQNDYQDEFFMAINIRLNSYE